MTSKRKWWLLNWINQLSNLKTAELVLMPPFGFLKMKKDYSLV